MISENFTLRSYNTWKHLSFPTLPYMACHLHYPLHQFRSMSKYCVLIQTAWVGLIKGLCDYCVRQLLRDSHDTKTSSIAIYSTRRSFFSYLLAFCNFTIKKIKDEILSFRGKGVSEFRNWRSRAKIGNNVIRELLHNCLAYLEDKWRPCSF